MTVNIFRYFSEQQWVLGGKTGGRENIPNILMINAASVGVGGMEKRWQLLLFNSTVRSVLGMVRVTSY